MKRWRPAKKFYPDPAEGDFGFLLTECGDIAESSLYINGEWTTVKRFLVMEGKTQWER